MYPVFDRCPLCNGIAKLRTEHEFYECTHCHELLYQNELVRRGNAFTKRQYQMGNNIHQPVKSSNIFVIRYLRYFVAGWREATAERPYSGATDERLMDAYWNGNRASWKVRRVIRRIFR